MKKPAAIISKTALASALKASPSTITGLIQRGLPMLANGKIDRVAALQWIVDHTSGHGGGWTESLRGKGALGERAAKLLGKAAKRALEGDARPTSDESFVDAQRRKEIALADLRQMEAAKMRGELVTIEDATAAWSQIVGTARSRLLGIPGAVAADVAQCSDVGECEAIVRRAVHEALIELSQADVSIPVGDASA